MKPSTCLLTLTLFGASVALACADDTTGSDEVADDTTGGGSDTSTTDDTDSGESTSSTGTTTDTDTDTDTAESTESSTDTTTTDDTGTDTTESSTDTGTDTTTDTGTDTTTDTGTDTDTTTDTGTDTGGNLSCDEIEFEYESLVASETDCDNDDQCQVLMGHCFVGLGGCHYVVNKKISQADLDAYAAQWQDLECLAAVCACLPPPNAVGCVQGTCEAL